MPEAHVPSYNVISIGILKPYTLSYNAINYWYQHFKCGWISV